MNRIKREKNKDYTTISNVFLRDERLSLKAKGFLAVVMGLPDDWDFSINGMCAILKEGRSAIYSTINELKEYGYCRVENLRSEEGKIAGNDYTFTENPCTEKPHTENLHTDNQTQLNTKVINNKTNKVNNNVCTHFKKPTIEEIQAYCSERNNNVDAEKFFDFYESKGWMIGKNKMKDWKACVRTWEREKDFGKGSAKSEKKQQAFDDMHVNDYWKNWK